VLLTAFSWTGIALRPEFHRSEKRTSPWQLDAFAFAFEVGRSADENLLVPTKHENDLLLLPHR
jgi:hypothetical protein